MVCARKTLSNRALASNIGIFTSLMPKAQEFRFPVQDEENTFQHLSRAINRASSALR
jgi:hypothetical protein